MTGDFGSPLCYRVTHMGTKRSLIEVVHDEGYGDALLMHMNHAFGTRDMRAERVMQSEPRLLELRSKLEVKKLHDEDKLQGLTFALGLCAGCVLASIGWVAFFWLVSLSR